MRKLRILLLMATGLFLASGATSHAATYSTWQAEHFTPAELADAAISGEMADPDGDEVVNLVEYAFGLDPWGPSVAPSAWPEAVEGYLQATYQRPVSVSDLAYIPQVSSDLANWFSGDSYVETLSITDTGGVRTVVLQDRTPTDPARFLRLLVTKDTDQDDLPDDWEMEYLGNLDSLGTDDNDFDTLNNFIEYSQQSDPLDFYNGETPSLVRSGGDAQAGFAGAMLPVPLTVTVFHQDGVTPWANAPVTFSTAAGGWFSAGASPAEVRSGGNGLASITYYLPETPGAVTIAATAGKTPNIANVSFTETVSSLPASMGSITAQGTGTGVMISWSPASGATSYTILRYSPATNTWQTIGTPGAGDDSFSDPDQPPGVILLYKMTAVDGHSLQSPSNVEACVANPDDNDDADALGNEAEVEAGYYSQALADASPTALTTLEYGGNPRGWHGPDPKLTDTDGDSVADDLDGWANNPAIHPPRLPEPHYAVIDLEALGFPAGYHVFAINDMMQVLAFSHPDPDADGYVDYDAVKDVILWDMSDRSTTLVPVLSNNASSGFWAPFKAGLIQSHHRLLNNNGMVCGLIYDASSYTWQAATWTKAGGTVLLPRYTSPFLSGTQDQRRGDDYVSSINDSGEVVGAESSYGFIPPTPRVSMTFKSEAGGVKWSGGVAQKIGDHWTSTFGGVVQPE